MSAILLTHSPTKMLGKSGKPPWIFILMPKQQDCQRRYRSTVLRALRKIGWWHYVDLINQAHRHKRLLIDIVEG